MDNISTKCLDLAQKHCKRSLVRVGITMVGGTQATESRVKTLLGMGGGRSGCKPNTAGGSVQNSHSVQADTHDYFLRRPKAGRLHPSSKSGPDMIISCGDLRVVGYTRHRKVSQNPDSILWRSGWWPCGSVGWCSKGCTRTLTIYGVARGLVGGPAARWGGVPKSCTRTPTQYRRCWPVGGFVVAPGPCGSMGWCSKSWGGVPKSCPRIPTLFTTNFPGEFVMKW